MPGHAIEASAADQGNKRQRILFVRFSTKPGLAIRFQHLLLVQSHGYEGSHYRAHAGATDHSDRHSSFAQCTHHADMRKTTRASATQHQPDRYFAKAARHPLKILLGVEPYMEMPGDIAPGEPPRRSGGQALAIGMQQYQRLSGLGDSVSGSMHDSFQFSRSGV